MSQGPWTDAENDLIVAEYFAMLKNDIAGNSYNKANHNRTLQTRISRSRGSIEYKHQNISAVLKALGESWIPGYRPAFNFQMVLVDSVLRWFDKNSGWADRTPIFQNASEIRAVKELWVGPPPTLNNQPPPEELDQMLSVARKFDVAGRDERNRALGRAGEERVLAHEKAVLSGSGQNHLSEKVRWVSEEDGDGAGYDISSFEIDGKPKLIEVKTTNGWDRTPFHISRNELAVSKARRAEWRLVRLWDFSRKPKAFELFPPLESHVSLTPTSFQARFH